MDNRFSIKDIILFLLVFLVGGLVLLSMMQKQRQWDVLQDALGEMKDQRESVDLYKRELAAFKREQDALRGGVEQMNTSVGEMTAGVQELIEVLKRSAAEGKVGGPTLGDNVDAGLGSTGPITFQDKKFDDDETFYRVAGLSDRADFAEGDFVIDAFGATVKNLTPYIAGDTYSSRIQALVMDSLLTVDPITLEHKPWVAKSWDISDDGLTVTYQMREDVVFADGHPMDSGDVVFSYNWVMNPKVAAPRMRSSLEKLASVTALDKYTVQFKFREPYFMALTVSGLYMDILPEHWVEQFTEEEYNKKPGLMFGSGPYKLRKDPKEWEPGTGKIELERNDNYWGPRPALDRVIYREITEDTARLAEFRNREIDIFAMPPTMYRRLSNDAQLREQANLIEYEYVSSGYIYVGWNQKKNGLATPFADKRVRKAMTMLIDRQTICTRILDNLATPATGPFHPAGWQADPSIEPIPFDPEAAAKLLEEAGYIDRDNNGYRESADGVPLRFEFIYSAGAKSSEEIAFQIKDAMQKAGVEMVLDKLDWPIMQQKLDDRSFDAIMLGWGGAFESDLYQMFHSDQTADGGDNYISHTNPELDELIEQARTQTDRDKCQALWHKVHAQLVEDQPYTFMFTRKAVRYIDKRMRNIEPTNIGLNYAWEYYVPGPDQLHND